MDGDANYVDQEAKDKMVMPWLILSMQFAIAYWTVFFCLLRLGMTMGWV